MNLIIEKDVPLPVNENKKLVNAIISLNDGDSVYLTYEEFSKTMITNCLSSARIRMIARNLSILVRGDIKGKRLWIVKRKQ